MKKLISILTTVVLAMSSVTAYGAVNKPTTLKILTEPLWDSTSYFSEGLLQVKAGDNYSFVDKTGKVIVKPFNPSNKMDLNSNDYETANDLLKNGEKFKVGNFHDGLAYISLGNDYTMYINKEGKTTLTYDNIKNIADGYPFPAAVNFSDGIAGGTTAQNEYRFISSDGKDIGVKNPYKFDDSNFITMLFTGNIFREGLTSAGFYKDDLVYGYIDKNSGLVINPMFESAGNFNQGMAFVSQGGKWGVINKKGDFIISPQFDDFMVTDADFSYKSFVDGLAVVKKGDKWGAVDTSGNIKVNFEWDEMATFSNGFSAVGREGKYGYVNKNGQLIVDCKYTDANPFYNGVALVGTNGAYKLIDTNGKAVGTGNWNFEASATDPSDSNLVIYKKDGKWGLAAMQ